jgi:2Fe-2S ferredoxin
MPIVNFVLKNGAIQRFVGDVGDSIMQVATLDGVPGIEAICGGNCECATCHVYVDPEWLDKLPAPAANELETMESVAAERRPNSRLSCQIKLTDAMDGILVTIPERQA